MSPQVSIVTPSYNMLEYLKRCHASVLDQAGVVAEHIVVDGLSQDGSVDWLQGQSTLTAICKEDRGMYDAINTGLAASKADILSYLNCDEQFLPGALEAVVHFFDFHPEIDIVFGDALLINPAGDLLAYRKGYTPRAIYVAASHLYLLSCTMFFRRKVVESGILFNSHLSDIADQEFVFSALRKGFKARHLRRYLSAFTFTGKNKSTSENARREAREFRQRAPRWITLTAPALNGIRLLEKFVSGAYSQPFPFIYEIYAGDDLRARRSICAENGTFRWPKSAGSQ